MWLNVLKVRLLSFVNMVMDFELMDVDFYVNWDNNIIMVMLFVFKFGIWRNVMGDLFMYLNRDGYSDFGEGVDNG